jgi:hypothetical protein
MLRSQAVFPLVVFAALMLALSLYGLAASGHFPREHRRAALASGAGPSLLFGSMSLAVLAFAAGLWAAWRLLPWYAVVIGAGGPLLMAPLVLQRFSDAFVDGRGALVVFAGAGVLFAGALAWLGSGP